MDRPAYDAVAQALSGMSSLFVDRERPEITGPTIADNVTGQNACSGILAALLDRGRNGGPRRVDVNMLESAIAFMPDPFAYYTHLGLISDQILRARTSQSYAFRCADDKLMTIHLSSQQKFWERFIEAIERPDLLAHPQMTSRMSRIDNFALVKEMSERTIKEKPRAYWLDRFTRYDVPVAPINDVTEVFGDPQVRRAETFFELEHPVMGKMTGVRRPIAFDGRRDDQPRRPPPLLGEHTLEILQELGFESASELTT